jgi:glycosyltransferase involved in cell wall biosynthesis
MSSPQAIQPVEQRETRRPKLLFLARPFPPLMAIGSIRTWNTAKYLNRHGWDVTVVTPHPSLWRRPENPDKITAETEQEGIRRIFTDHHWRWLNPEGLKCWNEGVGWVVGGICRQISRLLKIDRLIGWNRAAKNACLTLTPNDVDLILASGPPFAAFTLAKFLSDRLGRPYVLDYRDLWSRNLYRPNPAVTQREARLLVGCAGIITVSSSWGQTMDEQFGVGDKLHVITNGYDPEELATVKAHIFGHFAIVYAGSFRPPKRVIKPIMAALQRLKPTDSHKVFFHYYGKDSQYVKDEAHEHGVMNRVVLHGHVSREEALSAVRGCNLSVVITSGSAEERSEDNGMIPAKIYESLGLRSSVLLIAPKNSDARKVLQDTSCGRSFTAAEIDDIASYMNELIVKSRDVQTSPELYSWPHVVKRLDKALRTILHQRHFRSSSANCHGARLEGHVSVEGF